jgi:acetoacetyl-CoA synthetase
MRELLWTPSEEVQKASNMYAFMELVNREKGRNYRNYRELYRFSVDEPEAFWDILFRYLDIVHSVGYERTVDDIHRFPGAKWFPGCRLNYAENLLRHEANDEACLIFRGEDKVRRVLTWKDVKEQTFRLATALRELGVGAGDAVSAYLPNLPETIIAMLATAAVGGVWCSCATDIGPGAAFDRLGQVSPKVLFTTDGYYYKGKEFDTLPNAAQVAARMEGLKKVVVVHYAGKPEDIATVPNAVLYEDFLAKAVPEPFVYEQREFNDPTVVMFSSGTTGKPKCMVQSVGGLLINQLKELVLHHDMKPSDRMLYITTCSWMMWNWQAATLGAGSSIVLYDGNPSYPDLDAIWKVLEEEGVTVFGLSASYIHALMAAGFNPREHADLRKLRMISQTGSALSEEGFRFVYREIKQDLHFNSIAGGTDINGCFCIGNLLSPVYVGELQAPGLGMKIECYDENGKPVRDTQGELVCEIPEPSMPIWFANDPDGERYMNAYFRVYPGIWHHGDYVQFNSETGGVTYFGRSDSVLKPSGVRIGTAEIYNIVEKLPEVQDSLAIGQMYHDDQRILLFVQLAPGAELTEELKKRIKKDLRTKASPRHVPALIYAVPDLPKTFNGKKVESAVTNLVNGRRITNREALGNPESLDYFEALLPELQK